MSHFTMLQVVLLCLCSFANSYSLRSIIPDFSVACSGCVYKTSGQGFVRHGDDCSKYYWCFKASKQVYLRSCPAGLYWNNTAITCDWPRNVDCSQSSPIYTTTPQDPCTIRKPIEDAPRSCLELSGEDWVRKNCEDWQLYDVEKCDCVNDPCYGKKAWSFNGHFYRQNDNGVWKVLPCARGTAYNEKTCNCDIHSSSPFYPVCRPKVFLPLYRYYGIKDHSGNNHHVTNNGVYFSQNIAYWNGRSSLSVPIFTNGFYGNQLSISFYFKRDDNDPRVLLSNSVCDDVTPSILIYLTPDNICFKLRNEAGFTVSICLQCERVDVWQYVYLGVQNGRMLARIPTTSQNLGFNGNVASTHCPLTVGKGNGYDLFLGKIVWLTVYTECSPNIYVYYLKLSTLNPDMDDMTRDIRLLQAPTTTTTTTTTITTTTTTPPGGTEESTTPPLAFTP